MTEHLRMTASFQQKKQSSGDVLWILWILEIFEFLNLWILRSFPEHLLIEHLWETVYFMYKLGQIVKFQTPDTVKEYSYFASAS